MSSDSTGEHAPPDIVSASSERPTSRDDEGAVGSPPPNDETSPAHVEAHADGTDSPVVARARMVAEHREVRTLHVDYEEIVSDMLPMVLPPAAF